MTDNSETLKAGRIRAMQNRLRAAGVPSPCWDLSASKTQRAFLRTTATTWANSDERGSIKPGMFFHGRSDKQHETVALAAKEAVLAGLTAMHMPYNMLEMRLPAWQRAEGIPDFIYPLNELFGRGLLAIHSVPPGYAVIDAESRGYMDALAWIVSHLDHGGFLAICGDHPLEGRAEMDWPGEFLLPLRRYCNVYEV